MSMNRMFSIIALLVLVDFLTGYVKAYLKCELNSTIGLDGLIRKAMILLSMIVFALLDHLIGFDLVEWLPEGIHTIFLELNITPIGLTQLFGVGMILQESTSIVENLHEIGVPIPKWLAKRISRVRENYLSDEDI